MLLLLKLAQAPTLILIASLAGFAHRQLGGRAAAELLRGVVPGAPSFSAFFLVVAVALEPAGPVATYGLATLVSTAVNTAALVVDRRGRG